MFEKWRQYKITIKANGLSVTLTPVRDQQRRDECEQRRGDVEDGGLGEDVGAVRAEHSVREHGVHG